MLPGVVCSHGAGRIAPLTSECFESCMKQALNDDSSVVWMSDSALVYQELKIGTFGGGRQTFG